MKTALLTSAVVVLPFLAGCPGFCGGFSGGNDKVYAHGTESIIICDNGGFVANVTSGTIEGKVHELSSNGVYTANRDGGDYAFDLSYDADGNLETQGLDAGIWYFQALDATALDHADVQCTDLETRAWWTAQ